MNEQNIIWLKNNAPLIYVFFSWISLVLSNSGVQPTLMLVLGFSFMADYVLGVLAAIKTREFDSQKGLIGFLAKLMGLVLIICISILLKFAGISSSISLTSFFVIMSINDVMSGLRHWYTIRTGKRIKEYDAISELIIQLHNRLRKMVKKIMHIVNKNGPGSEGS